MKVLLFAQSRQLAGSDAVRVTTEKPITQAELWAMLIKLYPSLLALQKTARLARNETYLQADELLHPDDEIAIIPPVSGG